MSQIRVLENIRVLDLSPYLPSQYCSFQLAQLGAEVILVERPGLRPEAFPGLFELINAGKKSLQLDLKSDTGREVFYRLAAESDIIIEGFRPGIVGRLKLGYEDIKKVKPAMIYCSISGFGQEGPYRDMPGHDVNYLALSGYFSIPGQAGTPPSRPSIPIVDLCAGTMATSSILAALIARERNGEGQYIDIAMLDAITAWTSLRAGAYLVKGEAITDEHVMATNGVFQTRDNKLVALGIVNEEHFWRNFCDTAGHRALGEDPRFGTVQGRLENRQALSEILKAVFRERTEAEWRDLFKESDVPLCPVATLEEALADPQIVHRGMVKSIADPVRGEIKIAGFPAMFSGIATDIQSPPPRAGEHTRNILEQLGYPEEFISALETTK